MKLSHVFGGVYSKDQLPTLQRNKFYIINLQDSDAGKGSHWTVFFYNKPFINTNLKNIDNIEQYGKYRKSTEKFLYQKI